MIYKNSHSVDLQIPLIYNLFIMIPLSRALILLLFCLIPRDLWSQMGYTMIYGRITLKNGATYQGHIRFDGEQALWEDIFDAPKYQHPSQHLLTKAEAKRVDAEEDFSFGFMKLWEDKSPDQYFSFRCHFGDISRLDILKNELMLLTLKNGNKIRLKQGRRMDPDDDIRIYDNELGKLNLEVKNIQQIVFEASPRIAPEPMGYPVYGTILTTRGEYKGLITWDDDECLGKDVISGRDQGIKIDIEFKDIREITTHRDGSLITLASGRTVFLNKHDDVNKGNRGIMIHGQSFGKLKIDWQNFLSAHFTPSPSVLRGYNDFFEPKLLEGMVETQDGKMYKGQIIYDLDEIYNIEFLNGENNGFTYYIPFEFIKEIVPQNDKFSFVYLKTGERLVLGGTSDVNNTNHGLVVKLKGNHAEFITWDQINHITFN